MNKTGNRMHGSTRDINKDQSTCHDLCNMPLSDVDINQKTCQRAHKHMSIFHTMFVKIPCMLTCVQCHVNMSEILNMKVRKSKHVDM